jgi:hypothetical protein
MPRLMSTIAIDSRGSAPPQWSGSWVQRRLVEAYAVERRLPRANRRSVARAWPPMVVEWSDILGRADAVREQIWQSWEYSNVGVSAEDISRMDTAHDWLLILAAYPVERFCLSHWAAAIAYSRSLRRLLLKRGWSRTTFYRHVGAGAHIIALELERRKIPTS